MLLQIEVSEMFPYSVLKIAADAEPTKKSRDSARCVCGPTASIDEDS
jgi:hypothetical protein